MLSAVYGLPTKGSGEPQKGSTIAAGKLVRGGGGGGGGPPEGVCRVRRRLLNYSDLPFLGILFP